VATRSPPSRETQAVTACVAEVAGKVYLNMIMEILVIIIMLHHGADNYYHMGMQGDLQWNLHEGATK